MDRSAVYSQGYWARSVADGFLNWVWLKKLNHSRGLQATPSPSFEGRNFVHAKIPVVDAESVLRIRQVARSPGGCRVSGAVEASSPFVRGSSQRGFTAVASARSSPASTFARSLRPRSVVKNFKLVNKTTAVRR